MALSRRPSGAPGPAEPPDREASPVARRDSIALFHASMPARYRDIFDFDSAEEHHGIVTRRRGAPAHVELWRRVHGESVIVCVVADDRPGLLSLISSALVFHGLDIVAVHAYTRPLAEGTAEAIDFFWIKRRDTLLGLGTPSPLPAVATQILEKDIVRVEETLRRLVTDTVSVDALIHEKNGVRGDSSVETRVTFEDDPTSGAVVLTVETPDRVGLLFAITHALFRARVQILGSEVDTTNGRAFDRFTVVELDGTPIRMHRRGAVQVEVLSAIEALAAGTRGGDSG